LAGEWRRASGATPFAFLGATETRGSQQTFLFLPQNRLGAMGFSPPPMRHSIVQSKVGVIISAAGVDFLEHLRCAAASIGHPLDGKNRRRSWSQMNGAPAALAWARTASNSRLRCRRSGGGRPALAGVCGHTCMFS